MLNKEVFIHIMHTLGWCQTDLFTSRLNHQLPRYVAWKPDPFSVGTDALRMSWQGLHGYAFPPFALISKCLQKTRQERCTILLVAPTWTTQPWYPVLLEMAIADPLLLPQREDLLTDPFNRCHPIQDLQLAAWMVSGNSSEAKAYQRGLLTLSRQDGAKVQTALINRHGPGGLAGAINGRLIPFHVA